MDYLAPPPIERVLGRDARVIAPAAVEVDYVAGGIGVPDQLRDRLSQYAVTLLAFPNRLDSPFALRDVADHPGEQPPAGQVGLADRQVERERLSLFTEAHDLPADADNLPHARLPIVGKVLIVLAVVRVGHEHLDVPPDDLVGLVTEDAARSRVERFDRAVLAHGDDAVHRGLDHRAQPLLTLAHRFDHLRALGDVDGQAAEPGEAAFGSKPRRAPRQYPSIGPVEAAQSIFEFERLAALVSRRVRPQVQVAVVGVDAVDPTGAHLLIERPAREHQPRLVEVRPLPVLVGDPDHDRHGVGQGAEAFLAFAQGLLDLLAAEHFDFQFSLPAAGLDQGQLGAASRDARRPRSLAARRRSRASPPGSEAG